MGLIGFYAYFIWQTQLWTNFNPDYPTARTLAKGNSLAGEPVAAPSAGETAVAGAPLNSTRAGAASGTGSTATAQAPAAPATCGRSAIADIIRRSDRLQRQPERLDFVDDPLKLGLFGIAWDNTPFLDNKASFQRGINQAMRRTTTELVDNLAACAAPRRSTRTCRMRAAASQFDEDTWYFGLARSGPDADAELLPRGDRQAARLQRRAWRSARRSSTPAPTICSSSSTVSPATSARLRRSCGTGSRIQCRLVRSPRRRPLLVRLRPALCLLRHPDSRAAPTLRPSSRERNLPSSGHAWKSSSARRSTCSHWLISNSSEDRAASSRRTCDHGLLYAARPLQLVEIRSMLDR